jgi:hypothetical protein
VAADRARKQLTRLVAMLAILALAAVLTPAALAPASASAAAGQSRQTAAVTSTPAPGTPVLVTSQTARPPGGYRLDARQVERIAARSPTVIATLRRHPHLVPYEYTKGYPTWQVSWFTPVGHGPQKELIQVYVDDQTGRVTQAWTGFQVAWTMARGYPGAFGRIVNAWWLWIPLCVLFVAPFAPWPIPGRRRQPLSLLHLDLLMLLGFSISLAFFNHADLGMSVPLNYPFLLYLLGRMLLLAFGRGRPRVPLRPVVPTAWLALAVVFLIGFRVGLNVLDSNVIDVGYAGVIGAYKLEHGQPMYGNYPSNNANGDTYGPVNYYAYLPATAALGWSGFWDDLPAAHASAIAFDLLTMLGLFLLGRRVRGPTTGVVLAYLWAAYPFTLFALSSNSNDSLVAATTVAALLALSSPPGRGALAAIAGLTKYAPLALAPLLARGTGERWPRPRALALFALGFVLTAAAAFAPVIAQHNLQTFWRDSIVYQAERPAPFSIWGLYGGLSLEQHLVQGLAVGLALIVCFVPRRRTIVELAALGAAVIIAVQLSLSYWFYLYIPWFYGLVIVALACARPPREAALERLAISLREEPPAAAVGSIALASVRPSGPARR